jgi:ribosomal protein S18 acetylase RimI-like enzyme
LVLGIYIKIGENKMAQIKIRTMKTEDIDEVANIQEAITKKRVTKNWRKVVERYLSRNPETCLAAEVRGKVIGFILGDIKDWGFGVERSGWIEVIGVNPRDMGKGIGRKLGLALLKYFKKKKVKRVFTAVQWDSGDLLAFFKSISFTRSDFINLELELE